MKCIGFLIAVVAQRPRWLNWRRYAVVSKGLRRCFKSSTGILPVSSTGVSPLKNDKLQGQDGPATHGQDAHATIRQLLKHLLSCLSHLFLSEFCLKYRGEKSGLDSMPGSHGYISALSDLVSRRALFPETGRIDCSAIGVNATAKPQSCSQPSTPHNQTITCYRHKIEKHKQMSLESLVAL